MSEPPSVYPMPRDALVRQTVPGYQMPSLHVLASGAVVIIGTDTLVVTDEQLRVVRQIAHPGPPSHGFRQVDAAGRRAVTAHARIDLVSGEVTENPRGRTYVACDPDMQRCVTVEQSTDAWLHARVEDGAGAETDTFDIPYEAVSGARATRGPGPETSGLVAGSLVGTHLALTVHVLGPSFIVHYDLGARAVVASRLDQREELAIELSEDASTALVYDNSSVSLIEANAPRLLVRTVVRGYALRAASNAEKLVVREARGFRVYDRHTLAPASDLLPFSAFPVFGAGGSAEVSADGVRFVAHDGEHTTVAAAEGELPLGSFVDSATLTSNGFYALGDHGLLRVRPSDAAARFASVYAEHQWVYPSTLRDQILVRMDDSSFALGPAGITPITAEEEDARETQGEEASPDPYARFRALHDGSTEAVAIAGPERRGAAYGYVARGKAYLLDAEGHEVARPVPIPGNVARSQCSELAFISDVDLALSGGAPCIPTRIRFREGRTEPLGLAYVSIDSTPDGARVAMMAGRKLHIVDGRTGADLLTLEPELEHPRTIGISADGLVARLISDVGILVVDLRAIGTAETPTVLRFEGENVAYSELDDRFITCARGTLRVFRPFDEASEISTSFAPCSSADGVEWHVVPGYVAARLAPKGLFIVRLRDGATLEIEGVDTATRDALVVARGDQAMGVFPGDTDVLTMRRADGSIASLPPEGAASEAVRAFFAPSRSP